MTPDEFRERLAGLEARANVALGDATNRLTNRMYAGGRYTDLAGVLANMVLAPQRAKIDAWLEREVAALETEFYAPLLAELTPEDACAS